MSATIDVVCYKSKVLANNESPLMLRITKGQKLRGCFEFYRHK